MGENVMREQGMLPPGWVWTTISDISEQINSGFPSGQHNQEGRGVPHLRPMNISPRGTIDLSEVKCVEATNYDTLRMGDVLFNNTNSPAWVGKTAYIERDADWAYSNHMTRIRLRQERAYGGWIAHCLQYLFLDGFFQQNCRHHVNQASVNGEFLANRVSIPLPPLPEQHRIVAEIEKQFTRLDAGVAALKRVQANLKRYRASVLKAACEGRLAPQDPADEPAGRLLARILAERRAKWEAEHPGKKYVEPAAPVTDGLPELPRGWCWARVEQVADHRLGKMLDQVKNRGTLRPYLRNINVRWFRFDLSDVQEMRVTDEEISDISVQTDDLVVCEGGEPGRAAVWTSTQESMIIQKALHRVRLARGISPWYLAYRLATDAMSGELESYFTGSTIKHFTGQSLRSYVFPVPPSEEQHRIVAEVERRLSVVAELEATVGANLARAGRLRQAVLKRAFEGRLVAQEARDTM